MYGWINRNSGPHFQPFSILLHLFVYRQAPWSFYFRTLLFFTAKRYIRPFYSAFWLNGLFIFWPMTQNTIFYKILQIFTKFYEVLQNFTKLYRSYYERPNFPKAKFESAKSSYKTENWWGWTWARAARAKDPFLLDNNWDI